MIVVRQYRMQQPAASSFLLYIRGVTATSEHNRTIRWYEIQQNRRVSQQAGLEVLRDGQIAVVLTTSRVVRSAVPGSERSGDPETSVLVVDDHRSFVDLLCRALDSVDGLRCVGSAVSAAEGVALASQLTPDVAVVDIAMPNQDGLSATRQILAVSPMTVVVIMTAHNHPQWIAKAALAGASGFVPKTGSLDEMIDVIRRARNGQMLVAPTSFAVSASASEPGHGHPRLTDREQDVLQLLGRGLTASDIGRVLSISLNTCRGYIKSIHNKLRVSTQLEAVIKAQDMGLIGPRTTEPIRSTSPG